MTEPTFDPTTERVYERLPEFYRVEDEPNDWPLKKWLSGVCGEIDTVNDIYERIDYTPPDDGVQGDTSELVDPALADEAWLPWLAQIVGVKPERYTSTQDVRDAIANALTGAQPGTKEAIANAAKTVLTGSKTVSVYAASDGTGIGNGGEWDVLILTLASETPSDPAAAVIAQGAKPAGVILHAATLESSWDEMEADFTSWTLWENPWNTIEEVGF